MSEDATPPILGTDRDARRISGLEDLQAAAWAMAAQTRRTLDVVSRDLEPRLYDQPDFLDAVRQLATRSRYSRLRFLVRDVDAVVKADHRLLEIARRLSTFIEIRRLGPDDEQMNEAMLIADETGYIHRLAADRFEGEACFHNPMRARELTRSFDEMWARAVLDSNLRRLHL